MENENLTTVVEETAVATSVVANTTKSHRGLVIGVGVVATLGLGYGGYVLGRFIYRKIKAAKASKTDNNSNN